MIKTLRSIAWANALGAIALLIPIAFYTAAELSSRGTLQVTVPRSEITIEELSQITDINSLRRYAEALAKLRAHNLAFQESQALRIKQVFGAAWTIIGIVSALLLVNAFAIFRAIGKARRGAEASAL